MTKRLAVRQRGEAETTTFLMTDTDVLLTSEIHDGVVRVLRGGKHVFVAREVLTLWVEDIPA